jgi:glycosyltransferase involved in cell wall biosynthesis
MTTTANGKYELPETGSTPLNIGGAFVYRFRRITGDHSNFSPGLLINLWRSVRQYDVVHIQSWWNLVAMPAAWICLLRGVRPVISPRGSITSYTFVHRRQGLKRLLHNVAGRQFLKRSLIHVTSERERQDVLEAVPQAQIRVLPNFLDWPASDIRTEPTTDEWRILFLGRIDPKKRLDFLLRVLRGLDSVPWRLHIVGEGESQYVKFLKVECGDDPRITWHGPVYGEEKWRFYAATDLVALPSHNENYGNVVIEALSQGTPVLLSGQVGIADWVTANRLGWVADPDEASWREAILHIMDQAEGRERIRREGPQCVSRDFNPAELVKRYIAMYEEHRSTS